MRSAVCSIPALTSDIHITTKPRHPGSYRIAYSIATCRVNRTHTADTEPTMVSRKRAREETEAQSAPEPQEHGLLHQLRNMWEFPNLMQYIYTFGKPMKLDDDIDIEVCMAFE